MNKKGLYLVIVLIVIALGISISYFLINGKEKGNEIITYSKQIDEVVDNLPEYSKYFINSEDELTNFYKIYSSKLNIKKDYLNENFIFIETRTESGNTTVSLDSISFENGKISLNIKESKPSFSTDDLKFWYFVAIIPKEKLVNYSIEGWALPSEVLKSLNDPKPIDLDSYTFNLDNENKYEVITDMRYKTMLNDGGSHTNVYYQIDFEHDIAIKISEKNHRRIGETPSTTTTVLYKKKINHELSLELFNYLKEITSKEDKNETNNYSPFVIKSLNLEKDIYNEDTIKTLNEKLKKVDVYSNHTID